MPQPQILIVDDSRASRMMVKTCLKGAEIEIAEAENGLIAFDKCKANVFDLVIMDIHMPVLDGYDATRRIRDFEKTNSRSAMPIVALTAMDPAQAQAKTAAAGFTACINKPVRAAALREAIAAATGGKIVVPEKPPEAAPAAAESKGMMGKFFGRAKKEEGSDLEQQDLRGQRTVFLGEKRREVDSAMAAIDYGDTDTVTQLAYRLKGEGANYGFLKLSEFGGMLVAAIESRDMKSARGVVQKLQAYIDKAMEISGTTA